MTRPTSREERGAVEFGGTIIEYTVTRSRRRRKTIEISFDHGAGVLVRAPMRTPTDQIRQVVLKRASWIARRAALESLHPRRKELASGESVPYLGCEVPLVVERGERRRATVAFGDGGLRISVPAGLEDEARRAAVERAIVRWYRLRAAERLGREVERWSEVMGLAPARVLVRDQRRRWGSCSPDGTLRFNWRIIMAPPTIVDYLVVHELAHLRIKNHSSVFWAEVARWMPDYKAKRSALKEVRV